MLEAKAFNYQEHYGIVNQWWEKTHTKQPSFLPPIGVIIFNGDIPLAAGWMIRCYETDAPMVILDYFVSNPDVREQRSEAIDMLIYILENIASDNGYSIVIATPNYKRLVKRAVESHGYQEGENTTIIAKRLH